MLPSADAQLLAQEAAGVSTKLTVAMASGDAGRGVFYTGNSPLAAGTLVGLYRCLLVRSDKYLSLMRKGRVSRQADEWISNYTFSISFDDSPRPWFCLPIGESDGSSWWQSGLLSKAALSKALAALNMRLLVDWQMHYDWSSFEKGFESTPLRTLAPLFNEPSGDRLPNVDVRARGALHCGERRRYCGVMMASETLSTIQPGEELVWCYGDHLDRRYAVSTACQTQKPFGPWTKHEHAAEQLIRGRLPGRVDRHEFRQNCAAAGIAGGIEEEGMDEALKMDSDERRDFADALFKRWDANKDKYLDRDEVERGVRGVDDEYAPDDPDEYVYYAK